MRIHNLCLGRFQSYGKVPEYLRHRNEEVHRSVDEYNKYLKEQMEQGAMRELSEEERQANLEVLPVLKKATLKKKKFWSRILSRVESEDHLGRDAQQVQPSASGHGHFDAEESQGPTGGRDQAAGERRLPFWEIQDHLHCQIELHLKLSLPLLVVFMFILPSNNHFANVCGK